MVCIESICNFQEDVFHVKVCRVANDTKQRTEPFKEHSYQFRFQVVISEKNTKV